MQKTPVSILQEMMVKKGTVPNYELIHDGGGTHENTFTYKVSSEGLFATGTGRCKKDAKHAAAKNMLEAIAKHNGLLPLPASPADSPVRTPLPKPMPTPHVLPPNEPFVNAIGELQDLCAENELEDPVYETISDIGPPHARVFTIQCIVSSFKEEGVATTKKQAKHDAARKMYARVKELVDNAENSRVVNTAAIETKDPISTSSVDLAAKIATLPFHRKANLGVKMSEYHRKLIMSYDRELRQDIIQKLDYWRGYITGTNVKEWDSSFIGKMAKALEVMLLPMNVEVQRIIFPIETESINTLMMAIHLNTTPEIMEMLIGCDRCELAKFLFLRVIQTLKDFLA